jgi:hypothetical protein
MSRHPPMMVLAGTRLLRAAQSAIATVMLPKIKRPASDGNHRF